MKIVIVGGVAGGATAAARLRRLDESAQIVVFERSGYVSYANCGLPYYIGGVIEDPEELTLQTPQSFFSRFRVDVRVRHEVTAIHREHQTVSVTNLETGETFEESYDRLILAPGARPFLPELPGFDSDRILTLRTVEDTLRIRDLLQKDHPRSVLLAGGGFIAVELAENLVNLGIEVTLIEKQDHILAPFDADMASFLHAELRAHGVKLLLGRGITALLHEENSLTAQLSDGSLIRADRIISALGVTPETSLARDAGLALGLRGSIEVNEHMQTSDPLIYAVGDAVQVRHGVTGDAALIALAGPANKQGRIAADHIAGLDSRYTSTLGASILKVFDLSAASVGLSETQAKLRGLAADSVVLSPMSHAGYYPGGRMMTVKVIFDPQDFRLLGAQIVGYDGVDKRIDVLSTAMQAGMTGPELASLELAYAPPFSSAKDPVNLAGYMIGNIRQGILKQWHIGDAETLPRDGSVTLLDTRTVGEYARGHIEGFINIPVDELRERLSELPQDKPVYVICQSGLRSYIACRILAGAGLDAYNFSGGFRFYDAVQRDRRLQLASYPCGMDRD